ncbi:MAG: hypothetical protein E7231_07330 [Cellulosilyticum sp.]|nr:hypothetical protein [Cellulosilyticum sp.]
MKKKVNTTMVICLGLLLIIGILLGNTNHNPTSFLLRIIPPFKQGNGEFYYANLVILIVIPFILFDLYKSTNWRFLDSIIKRFVATIVFLCVCGYMNQWGIQFYKSFQSDLDAIYLEREEMGITYNWRCKEKDGKAYTIYNGGAYITLKNCSKKVPQSFKVQLVLNQDPDFPVPKVIEKAVSESREIILVPGEIERIQVFDFEGLQEVCLPEELGRGGSRLGGIEQIVIYNSEQKIDFLVTT